MVVPIVEKLDHEHPDIKVGKINVDKEVRLASQFGIMIIPTLVVIENGKIINQVWEQERRKLSSVCCKEIRK